jgi:hypothetical protein
MARKSQVAIAIYREHLRLFRYLNDTWIRPQAYAGDSLVMSLWWIEPTTDV